MDEHHCTMQPNLVMLKLSGNECVEAVAIVMMYVYDIMSYPSRHRAVRL